MLFNSTVLNYHTVLPKYPGMALSSIYPTPLSAHICYSICWLKYANYSTYRAQKYLLFSSTSPPSPVSFILSNISSLKLGLRQRAPSLFPVHHSTVQYCTVLTPYRTVPHLLHAHINTHTVLIQYSTADNQPPLTVPTAQCRRNLLLNFNNHNNFQILFSSFIIQLCLQQLRSFN